MWLHRSITLQRASFWCAPSQKPVWCRRSGCGTACPPARSRTSPVETGVHPRGPGEHVSKWPLLIKHTASCQEAQVKGRVSHEDSPARTTEEIHHRRRRGRRGRGKHKETCPLKAFQTVTVTIQLSGDLIRSVAQGYDYLTHLPILWRCGFSTVFFKSIKTDRVGSVQPHSWEEMDRFLMTKQVIILYWSEEAWADWILIIAVFEEAAPWWQWVGNVDEVPCWAAWDNFTIVLVFSPFYFPLREVTQLIFPSPSLH